MIIIWLLRWYGTTLFVTVVYTLPHLCCVTLYVIITHVLPHMLVFCYVTLYVIITHVLPHTCLLLCHPLCHHYPCTTSYLSSVMSPFMSSLPMYYLIYLSSVMSPFMSSLPHVLPHMLVFCYVTLYVIITPSTTSYTCSLWCHSLCYHYPMSCVVLFRYLLLVLSRTNMSDTLSWWTKVVGLPLIMIMWSGSHDMFTGLSRPAYIVITYLFNYCVYLFIAMVISVMSLAFRIRLFTQVITWSYIGSCDPYNNRLTGWCW